MDLRKIVQKLPKSELHVHLRGAMPAEAFGALLGKYPIKDALQHISDEHRDLFRRYGNIRPFLECGSRTADAVSTLFRYADFEQFLATWTFTGYFIRDISDLRRLVDGVLQSLKRQNITYAEITISAIEYMRRGISLEDISTCIEESQSFPGIRAQWIVDLVRNTGAGGALHLLHEVLDLQCKHIVGITLGGNERRFPPAQFSEVYRTAREYGLRLSVHAGEALGPQSVWDAIKVLGAERIGHGVRAIEDASLVAYLAEH